MPWKNGGGETIEIMTSPDGAALDAFDWRLSMAHVSRAGPFSLFPEIDRTLSVIAGAGLRLTVGAYPPVNLGPTSTPFSFRGDIATDCTLIDGPIDDLNVMTRRDHCRHRVARHQMTEPLNLRWQGNVAIGIPIGNSVTVAAAGETILLSGKDTVEFDRNAARACVVTPHGDCDFFLIEIWQPDAATALPGQKLPEKR